ncbi:hypothetical protein K1719_033400 [Acacia pycnantha]|nr:hypothetical protein K1719_033400 [Acacia pycnantha]
MPSTDVGIRDNETSLHFGTHSWPPPIPFPSFSPKERTARDSYIFFSGRRPASEWAISVLDYKEIGPSVEW